MNIDTTWMGNVRFTACITLRDLEEWCYQIELEAWKVRQRQSDND